MTANELYRFGNHLVTQMRFSEIQAQYTNLPILPSFLSDLPN